VQVATRADQQPVQTGRVGQQLADVVEAANVFDVRQFRDRGALQGRFAIRIYDGRYADVSVGIEHLPHHVRDAVAHADDGEIDPGRGCWTHARSFRFRGERGPPAERIE